MAEELSIFGQLNQEMLITGQLNQEESLFGKLNNEISFIEYYGGSTDTADVFLDGKTIKVNVKKVPHKLTVTNIGDISKVFDGSNDISIDLTAYDESVIKSFVAVSLTESDDVYTLNFLNASGDIVAKVNLPDMREKEEIVDLTLRKQYNNITSERTYGTLDGDKLEILNNNSKAKISLSYSDIGGILLSRTRTDQNGAYYTNTLSLMTYDGTIASFALRLNLNSGTYWLISIPLMSRPDIMTEIDKVTVKKVSITTDLTSGTLSEEELTTLTDNEQNYISLNGNNYYLSKSADGTLKYTHIDEDNNSLNTITVTTADGNWNLTSTILATQAESQCVFAYNGATLFPVVGQINKIYIDTSENVMYRYDTDTSKYVIIGQNPNNITQIKGTYPLLG